MLLKIDYCTFQFPDFMTVDRLQDFLGVDLQFESLGSRYFSPYGITFRENCGFSERPVMIQFSGDACTRWQRELLDLFNYEECHISRCDIAFDHVSLVHEWKHIVHDNFALELEEARKAKKIVVQSNGWRDSTIYIGSRRSPYYFRQYCKSGEDPHYKTLVDGQSYDLREGEILIRYEIEFKRFRRTLNGVKQLFDPTVVFLDYYNDHEKLIKYIGDLWSSYALPISLNFVSFDLGAFQFLYEQTKNFAQSDNFVAQWPDIVVQDPIPYSSGVHWVVDHFAAYIPYIINNAYFWQVCKDRFRAKYGFDCNLMIVSGSESEFEELDYDEAPEPEFIFEQTKLDLKEGMYPHDEGYRL